MNDQLTADGLGDLVASHDKSAGEVTRRSSEAVDASTQSTHLVEVYDRPMCCSSGLCGPSTDPELARFAADLEWLRTQGVRVDRYNLAQQPGEFTRQADIVQRLHDSGVDALPIVRVDGCIVSQSAYPLREQLAAWSGLAAEPRDPLAVLSQKCCSS